MAEIKVDELEYEAETKGLDGIRELAKGAGALLDKAFRADDAFPKTDPRAKRGSSFEAARNTVEALGKAVKVAVDRETELRKELDEMGQAITILKSDVRHLSKGDKPCAACDVTGKKDGKDCGACGATGYVEKPKG